MAKKPPAKPLAPRAARRALERDLDKLARDVRRLDALEIGGSPTRPLQLTSASEVEVSATGRPCPICQGSLRLDAHEVTEDPIGGRLRVARLTCAGCRAQWSRFFRLGPPPLS